MRAARYYGKEDIRIEEIPEETTGPDQIKIAPAYVGICGTDLHEYLGGPTFAPVDPHPVTKETIPITFGHEFSGIIKEIGSKVPQGLFRVGQKVAIQPTVYCDSCGACKSGVENACYNGGFIGLSGGGGGLSDAVVVPARAVLPLPDNVPLDIGALVEPLSVAWHATEAAKSALTKDSTVLVLGGGPIGLAVVQCLAAKKTKKIIMSEVAAQRQRFAKEFGAHHVLDPKTYDLVAVSKTLSGGDGPDVVFDCAGVPASLVTACNAVKARGTVVNVAIWEKEVPFQPNMLTFKEANYTAVLGYQRRDFEAVIENLANGSLKPHRMITGRIQLEDLISKGFMPLINEKERNVKILVEIAPQLEKIDSLQA
ncbi:Alcohol dehydrogenase superfamily zinc-containing [Macrophomina phaseolina MS6]|uniref:Alcohol dehydrogenase superfamily zinc-containing n=2 Tax=Macrophomina phaseolina TaxID=35725 RepID=K2RMQ9_MACPH|nr:Alcohol dehydrogenase superfamily zinc-containing [Macrophomina phaseolina MS6]KAH7051214.1 chaperonin 10-like protein [Macrophomina phaseolina]